MYETKNYQYFSNVREDLISLLPKGRIFEYVLEVGCGNGATLCALKERDIAKKTFGIDLIDLKDNKRGIDTFISGDVEKIELSFDTNYFDLIILGEVLEHLVNPWNFLKKMNIFLKSQGIIVASLPNLRYFSVVKKLLLDGNFQYEKSGILDQTHLRFFCKRNIFDLFYSSYLKPVTIFPDFALKPRDKRNLYNKLSFGLFSDFMAYQYLILAKKAM
jgi:SAM-dependent methyltransferase